MKDVDSTHPSYDKYLYSWNTCRLVSSGSEAVKNMGDKLLPMLEDQKLEEYLKYKSRALFFEATTRTITGLVGMMFAKEPEILEPEEKNFLKSTLPGYLSVKSFLKEISKEIITVGRHSVLVDVDSSGKPYLATYQAEDIINWRIENVGVSRTLTLVVLREKVVEHEGFKNKEKEYFRVLQLDSDGFYYQELYEKVKDTSEFALIPGYPLYPEKKGRRINEIPFYFIGVNGLSDRVERPPLSGLVNVNISHYQNSADLEHGRHFTGLPTPWVAGFSSDEDNTLSIGSQSAWISNDPNAKAGFLEFTGQGLSSLENALKEKQDMMIILGARLLEAPKLASESSANQVIRKQGESSILSNIADSVSDGVGRALKFAAEWEGENPDDYGIGLNREFASIEADHRMVLALMQQFQNGLISYDTYFFNAKRSGLIPDEVTSEQEKSKIEIDRPMFFGNIDNLDEDS